MSAARGYMPKAERVDWGTPPAFFDGLARRYGPFDLDPCGSAGNYVSMRCRRFFDGGAGGSGLVQPWFGRVFMNPPYGPALRHWVQKGAHEVLAGNAELVVALLPARTDTLWWHDYVGTNFPREPAGAGSRSDRALTYASEVRFHRGRLTFVGADSVAPFPSVVVVWRKP